MRRRNDRLPVRIISKVFECLLILTFMDRSKGDTATRLFCATILLCILLATGFQIYQAQQSIKLSNRLGALSILNDNAPTIFSYTKALETLAETDDIDNLIIKNVLDRVKLIDNSLINSTLYNINSNDIKLDNFKFSKVDILDSQITLKMESSKVESQVFKSNLTIKDSESSDVHITMHSSRASFNNCNMMDIKLDSSLVNKRGKIYGRPYNTGTIEYLAEKKKNRASITDLIFGEEPDMRSIYQSELNTSHLNVFNCRDSLIEYNNSTAYIDTLTNSTIKSHDNYYTFSPKWPRYNTVKNSSDIIFYASHMESINLLNSLNTTFIIESSPLYDDNYPYEYNPSFPYSGNTNHFLIIDSKNIEFIIQQGFIHIYAENLDTISFRLHKFFEQKGSALFLNGVADLDCRKVSKWGNYFTVFTNEDSKCDSGIKISDDEYVVKFKGYNPEQMQLEISFHKQDEVDNEDELK